MLNIFLIPLNISELTASQNMLFTSCFWYQLFSFLQELFPTTPAMVSINLISSFQKSWWSDFGEKLFDVKIKIYMLFSKLKLN